MKLIEEENELSASGLLTGETATKAGIIPEEISACFADAGNALVKATIRDKKAAGPSTSGLTTFRLLRWLPGSRKWLTMQGR